MQTEYGQVELLKCSQRILNKYRINVKNNQNYSDEIISKKIQRNYILAQTMFRKDFYEVRRFGRLIIKVDLDSMQVVDVVNSKNQLGMTWINIREKQDLNKLLKIK